MQLIIGVLAFTSTFQHGAGSFLKAGLPDKMCKTGVLSVDTTVCCASFCGECGDYPTCSSIRGQNSTTQCCKSQVAAQECGTEGVSANACLKKCSRSPPPCIMDFEVTVPDPATMVTAGEDCGEARKDWRMRAAAIVGDQKAIQAQNDIDSGKYRSSGEP